MSIRKSEQPPDNPAPAKRGPGRPKGSKTDPTRKLREEQMRYRRAQQLARSKAKIMADRDIGEIPPPKHMLRRLLATSSFRMFCEIYFKPIFYLPWSKDLLRVIAKIERVVVDHDTLAIAMPRGSGKTRLCQAAALWAVLTGQHRFVILVGAVGPDARKAIVWFKSALSENPLLLEDWPEICYPIKLLDNDGRRCNGQRYMGQRTSIGWTPDRITMPTIPGSKAAGSIISTASLEGHIRGQWVKLPGGTVGRPTLAICDDPQTRESARSQGPDGQTSVRLQVINEDVQGLAGPDQQTAILVPCTVICRGDLADQLLDRVEFPNYRGERTKRFYSWPTNKVLWEEYRELRDSEMRADEDSSTSMEFYRSRMATCGKPMDEARECATCSRQSVCMDCGAVVDWAARLDDKRNLSAVQASMHSLYKYKEAGFAAEFQNEPILDAGSDKQLTAEACAAKISGREWAEVPLAAIELTIGVDVQQSSLWYVVVAWEPGFTGHIVDYGVWPKQLRAVYTLADIVDSSQSLKAVYPGRGIEGTIQAGLEELVTLSLSRDFSVAGSGGGSIRVSQMLVDSGKWPGTIAAAKHKCGGAAMMLSRGLGIKAGNKPMASYRRKPGERHDPHGHWYIPSTVGTREFPAVVVDVNWWKSFVHRGFLTAAGDPGALTLFGDDPRRHSLFASHITAETYVTPTSPNGIPVDEWTIRPYKPDNHWLDATVLACVAASMRGIVRPNAEAAQPGIVRRVRVPITQMLARRRHEETSLAS